MKTHELKTWPIYFASIWNRAKSFEIRKDDRHFNIGDSVLLREYDPEPRTYTGRSIDAMIVYKISGCEGLKKGYCVFGITAIIRHNDEPI